MERLLDIMRQLRDPDRGCPWDLEQNFKSIVPHTLEEAYEVVDAIEKEDFGLLKEELGDLLFQVVFYAQLAKEQGLFEFNDIVDKMCKKLVRRHPHVFGDASIASSEEQELSWEKIKQEERQKRQNDTELSAVDGVVRHLPALMYAYKVQKRAARVGFDWKGVAPVMKKLHEEVNELQEAIDTVDGIEEELGDVLFTVVNLARKLNVEPEMCLRRSTDKFERRFRCVEKMVSADDSSMLDMSELQLTEYWDVAKAKS